MLANRTLAALASIALLTVAGCAAGKALSSAAAPSRGSVTFIRDVASIPVFDAHGRLMDHPFLGGMDAPRPQFVDIDGDGDLDLFVQVYSNSLWYFENTGTPSEPRYVWRSDNYQDLNIGEWYRFVDLDGDGLVDLLAEEPFSYVKHFRNAGSRGEPRFVYVDSLRDGDGNALFIDRQNIPALVDIDCDGRLDLFVGRVEGVVSHYEAVERNVPRFNLQQDFWQGIEIIGQIDTSSFTSPSTPTTRHGANAIAFADFDGDGDMDLFWGDFFEPGVLIIENIGRTCSTPNFTAAPYLLPYADSVLSSGYNAPVPVDINNDGRLDFVMGVLGGAYNPLRTTANNLYFWERVAQDNFVLRTTRFLHGIDIGSESAPALVDLNGDGVLDMVIGNKLDPQGLDAGRLYIFMNEGTTSEPVFRLTDTLQIADAYTLAPAFADLDGDGDPDLLLGTWSGEILFFRNVGSARDPLFVQDSALTISLPRVSNSVPALVDIDGDGDLDLFVGEASGEILFLRNEGSAREPRFTLVSERLGDIDVGRRSAPTFHDIDGDGIPELVVGREEGGVLIYRNAGGGATPSFVPYQGTPPHLPLPPLSHPVFGDINGDGIPDILSGTASGGVVLYLGRR